MQLVRCGGSPNCMTANCMIANGMIANCMIANGMIANCMIANSMIANCMIANSMIANCMIAAMAPRWESEMAGLGGKRTGVGACCTPNPRRPKR